MFNSVSKAGVGGSLVVLLNAFLPLLGFDLPEGSVAGFVESILNIVGFVLLIWGQIDRRDLKFGLLRR